MCKPSKLTVFGFIVFFVALCSPFNQCAAQPGIRSISESSMPSAPSQSSSQSTLPGFRQFSTIDIVKQHVEFRVDVPQATILVKTTTVFQLPIDAVPLFDLKPDIERAWVDGVSCANANFPVVSPPDNTAHYRNMGIKLDSGLHTLQLRYELTPENTQRCRFECSVVPDGRTRSLTPAIHTFGEGQQFDFLMAVMDYAPATYRTDGRTFLERYIPSGREADLHRLTINVELFGTDIPHRIIANGTVNDMSVTFSQETSCSSAYFHIVPEPRYFISNEKLDLGEDQIDLVVYSTRQAGKEFHDKSVSNVKLGLSERSTEMGFYPNPQFIAHLYPKAGGMEYTGATSCAPSALRHEITHSWFGRGMRPSSGADGWIDEAITTWWVDRNGRHSDEPPPAEQLLKKRYRKLSFDSRHFRMTPSASYRQGAEFISYLASVYASGNKELKPVLIDFAIKNMHQPITTEQFLGFVLSEAPQVDGLHAVTQAFVFGSTDEK